ncbi:hypothetical protein G6F68_019495 [Rhizopus microsporus]|nr:hypothetical protein G6F68_019495 [Rhizopus microsporus]
MRGQPPQQGVAVRLGLGHHVGADVAIGATLVFADDALAQLLGQLGRPQAAHGIRAAAGRERHDQLDGLGRPGASLRPRCRRQQDQQAGRRRGQDGKASVRHGFVLLHGCLLMVVVGISPGVRV